MKTGKNHRKKLRFLPGVYEYHKEIQLENIGKTLDFWWLWTPPQRCRIFASAPAYTYIAQVGVLLTKIYALCPILQSVLYICIYVVVTAIANCLFFLCRLKIYYMIELQTRFILELAVALISQHCPLKVLSDENQGGSKLVSIDSFFFTV